MEHRWGKRILRDQMVQCRSDNGTVRLARLRDISLSGAFLQVTPWRGSGSLEVCLGARTQTVSAHVVRVTRDGIGIEWSEFAPVQLRAIFQESRISRATRARLSARTSDRVSPHRALKAVRWPPLSKSREARFASDRGDREAPDGADRAPRLTIVRGTKDGLQDGQTLTRTP